MQRIEFTHALHPAPAPASPPTTASRTQASSRPSGRSSSTDTYVHTRTPSPLNFGSGINASSPLPCSPPTRKMGSIQNYNFWDYCGTYTGDTDASGKPKGSGELICNIKNEKITIKSDGWDGNRTREFKIVREVSPETFPGNRDLYLTHVCKYKDCDTLVEDNLTLSCLSPAQPPTTTVAFTEGLYRISNKNYDQNIKDLLNWTIQELKPTPGEAKPIKDMVLQKIEEYSGSPEEIKSILVGTYFLLKKIDINPNTIFDFDRIQALIPYVFPRSDTESTITILDGNELNLPAGTYKILSKEVGFHENKHKFRTKGYFITPIDASLQKEPTYIPKKELEKSGYITKQSQYGKPSGRSSGSYKAVRTYKEPPLARATLKLNEFSELVGTILEIDETSRHGLLLPPPNCSVRTVTEPNKSTSFSISSIQINQKLLSKIEKENLNNYSSKMELLTSVIEKVQELHNQGIIHGDIKLANIMKDNSQKTQLIDFGNAVNLDADIWNMAHTSSSLGGTYPPPYLQFRDDNFFQLKLKADFKSWPHEKKKTIDAWAVLVQVLDLFNVAKFKLENRRYLDEEGTITAINNCRELKHVKDQLIFAILNPAKLTLEYLQAITQTPNDTDTYATSIDKPNDNSDGINIEGRFTLNGDFLIGGTYTITKSDGTTVQAVYRTDDNGPYFSGILMRSDGINIEGFFTLDGDFFIDETYTITTSDKTTIQAEYLDNIDEKNIKTKGLFNLNEERIQGFTYYKNFTMHGSDITIEFKHSKNNEYEGPITITRPSRSKKRIYIYDVYVTNNEIDPARSTTRDYLQDNEEELANRPLDKEDLDCVKKILGLNVKNIAQTEL